MPSKLSIHLSAYPDRVFDILAAMQPSVVKVFNQSSEINIDAIRARCPNTIIVYRQYTNQDYHGSADAFFAEIADTFNKLRGRGLLWEGINEPIVNTADDARALNAWYVRFADLMHARGELVAGFSWSTGNPTPDKMGIVMPLLTQAAAAVDVHAFHEYYSTWGGQNDWGKYRAFEAALPQASRKPIVITEAGLDDNGDPNTGGWRGKKSPQEYLDILKAYDDVLMTDPYALGATVYQWGDGGWPSFDLSTMVDLISNYVVAAGRGVVYTKPWPVPSFTPPGPSYSFSATPGTIRVGQSATLKWDVEGAGAVYLDGQGVGGHGTRTVTPTQTTTYTLHIIFPDNSTKDLTAIITVNPADTPTISFIVTPSTIAVGQTATLKWDVDGVREVYLDGQGVIGHDTRIVMPPMTTTYTLHIVFLDGTDTDLTTKLTVNALPTPTFSISAVPGTIQTGQSATLQWDVDGVRAVYLDGQGVIGHGTRVVMPTQTTTYTLHILLLDGSTKDLTAVVIVSGTAELQWDPRLDALGVKLTRAASTHAWRLVSAQYQDPGQTGNDHNVYFKALRADGSPAAGLKFRVDWTNRASSDQPADVTTDANGQANVALWASFDPNLKNGIYFATTKDDAGDTVSGMGLPNNRHVNFLLTYSWDAKVVPTPSYAFTATPSVIASGASATLNWNVQNASAVTLDGQPVAPQGAKNVTPPQTTTYTLHVVLTDGTTKDLSATIVVATLPPLQWDPRLDGLGVKLTRAAAAHAWRLVSAQYQDPGQTGNDHHVFVKALRADGSPAAGLVFVVDWVNRDPRDQPAYVTTDANGQGNCPLWASFDPSLKNGIYFATTKDEAGDTVSGMGLPNNRHVDFILTFVYS